MTLGTLLVGLILLAIVALIIRGMIHDKKRGVSSCGNSCGGSCASCPHHCVSKTAHTMNK